MPKRGPDSERATRLLDVELVRDWSIEHSQYCASSPTTRTKASDSSRFQTSELDLSPRQAALDIGSADVKTFTNT